MSLLQNTMAKSGVSNFYNGVATTSLRLAGGATLTNTYGTPTSRKKMSFGGWVKRAIITKYCQIWGATTGGAVDQAYIVFDANDKLFVQIAIHGSGNQYLMLTDRVFRDTSAWYHLWVEIDSTDGTAADRVKVYINGVRETKAATTTIADGSPDVIAFNVSGVVHYFGHGSAVYGGDLYYSDWYFIDGSDVSPIDTVGEFKFGVWIPKAYTPSEFGTNGWHLKFDQVGVGTPSATTIGADSSGKDTLRHWTSTADTDVVARDCNMPDSPENNFATLNPLDKHATFPALAEGNLKTVNAGSAWFYCRSTFSVTSGKWYVEIRQTGKYIFMGVLAQTLGLTTNSSSNSTGVYACFNSNGDLIPYSTGTSGTDSGDFTDGDIVGLAYDYDAQTLKIYQDNTLRATVSSIPKTEAMSFMCGTAEVTNTTVWNFGQDASFAGAITAGTATDGNGKGVFLYAPPSGYLALCTANLTEPTIGANSDTQADDYFGIDLYTGNDGTQTRTTNFKPDWLWIKSRAGDQIHSHFQLDSSRSDGTKYLKSDTDDAESTDTTIVSTLEPSGSTGFTLGSSSVTNDDGTTYVAWHWKANGGTTSSNTDGSITSTVQANTDAGFSIVTYTGNSTDGATIGHGLLSEPQIVIVKVRTQSWRWLVYFKGVTSDLQTLVLDDTADVSSLVNPAWSTVDTTSSVFGLGNNDDGNKSTENYIAYAFHSVEGYSKCGSYTGNGDPDGSFVYTGFRPAFIMIKSIDSTSDWLMFDNKREGYNVDNDSLSANSSGVEATTDMVDLLSNGFKLRDATDPNVAETYIYMAFGDSFKYANAR